MIALKETEYCALAVTDCRPTPLRRWASRPQLRRDPLGGATWSFIARWLSYWSDSFFQTARCGRRIRSQASQAFGGAQRVRPSWPVFGKPTEDLSDSTV